MIPFLSWIPNMTMNPTTNPYGGCTTMVDKRIGNAYPVVKAVYEALDYLKYLAENLNALRPKDIELQMDEDGQYIQWRYAAKDDQAASPWQDLWTLAAFFNAVSTTFPTPAKIPRADVNSKIDTGWLKLDEIAEQGSVTRITTYAALPAEPSGFVFVEADETKDGNSTMYFFGNSHRYWMAMVQDD